MDNNDDQPGALFSPPDLSPETLDELARRASGIAGLYLSELADACGFIVPKDLKGDKGWVGRLIERSLGAFSKNLPVPDFERLGVELKTLPVDRTGKVLETTYVTMVPLLDLEDRKWEASTVAHKLAKVLWVPILAERRIDISKRMVGQAMLWTPDSEELALLKRDWRSHIETIRDGYVESITARDGEVLQIRPKAAKALDRRWSIDEDGDAIMTNPRGFYLRRSFTQKILDRRF